MQLFFLIIIDIFFWFLAFLFQVIHVIFSGLWKLGKRQMDLLIMGRLTVLSV